MASFSLVVRPAAFPVVLACIITAYIAILRSSWLLPSKRGSAKLLRNDIVLISPRPGGVTVRYPVRASTVLIILRPQLPMYNYKTWHAIVDPPCVSLGRSSGIL